MDNIDDTFIKSLDCMGVLAKWFVWQVLLYFLMPYLWNYEYGVGTIISMLIYTAFYAVYWEFIPKAMRIRWIFMPYFAYSVLTVILYGLIDNWSASVWTCLLLPFYGFVYWIGAKFLQKYLRKIKRKYKMGWIVSCLAVLVFFIVLKALSVSWMCRNHGSIESEKADIIERRNYLVNELVTTPQEVLGEMPAGIGTQFKGEWALYSCSMLSAALVNISHLYPDTKEKNLQSIDSLIKIVMSPEMRYYDTMRWNEDPLESLNEDNSHVSYLSHLAWMICSYK